MTKKQKNPYRDWQESGGFHFEESKQQTSLLDRVAMIALIVWSTTCTAAFLIGMYEYFT